MKATGWLCASVLLIGLLTNLGLAIYEAMTLDYPYRPELWRGLAAAYAAKGRLAEAIAACRRIIALDPRDQQAIANLEKLLKNQRGD
jgi:Flp pilus assembly protein TadD